MSIPDKQPAIRLLVVDDDETLLEMMQQGFERKGMKVFATGTGMGALDIAGAGRIDIALLDVNLPDANGLELLTKLKDQHPDLAVIMLAAHASIENAIQAMRS